MTMSYGTDTTFSARIQSHTPRSRTRRCAIRRISTSGPDRDPRPSTPEHPPGAVRSHLSGAWMLVRVFGSMVR